jgi:ribosomal protein S18 acetylase RimI-like enzyme
MMNINIQKADTTLLKQLAAMNKQLIIDEGHHNPMTIEQLAERMRNWLQGEYSAYIVSVEGEIAGYCLFRDEGDYMYIRQLFVWEKYRRRGIGQTLVDWLAENIWNGQKTRMDVLCNNINGIKFWRSIGFADYCITMER